MSHFGICSNLWPRDQISSMKRWFDKSVILQLYNPINIKAIECNWSCDWWNLYCKWILRKWLSSVLEWCLFTSVSQFNYYFIELWRPDLHNVVSTGKQENIQSGSESLSAQHQKVKETFTKLSVLLHVCSSENWGYIQNTLFLIMWLTLLWCKQNTQLILTVYFLYPGTKQIISPCENMSHPDYLLLCAACEQATPDSVRT